MEVQTATKQEVEAAERPATDNHPQVKDSSDPPPTAILSTHELKRRSFYRALIAEFVGSFLLLYITVTTVIGDAHQKQFSYCGGVGMLGIAWASGATIFVLVYCTAGISGGHLNPAVTFALFLARMMCMVRTVLYMLVQCTGAVCGAALAKAYQSSYYDELGGAANRVKPGYSIGTALAAETVGTFVLVYTVLSTINPRRRARDSHVPVLGPFPIGFAVFVVNLATIPITGTGINPARSFATAVVYGHSSIWHVQWIFWLGPFIGAALAECYHQHILRASSCKGLESINESK